jgi:hypothetical protein
MTTNCSGGVSCSARGGADAEVDGTVRAEAVSLIDVVAPNNMSSVTFSSGPPDVGTVGGAFVGTSAATPAVSGLAALVKDWMLGLGNTWINSPGRLHTIMLAMADRHYSSSPGSSTTWTQQLTSNPSRWYGVGRSKLRVLEPGQGLDPVAYNMDVLTFSGAGGASEYRPFGTSALPSGVALVKCVLFQLEDMSAKSDISDVDLTVKVDYGCNGSINFTRASSGYDTKKVVAIGSGTATLPGSCIWANVSTASLTTDGITTQTFCYYAGVNDDG